MVNAWEILKELDLQDLLEGGTVTIEVVPLIEALLSKGKLAEFLQIITGNEDVDFGAFEIEEIMEMIANFFVKFMTAFQKLAVIIKKSAGESSAQTPSGD
jgi:hypothetical protein